MQTEALTTILVQLVEHGNVSLDAPIAKWLPNLPHAGDALSSWASYSGVITSGLHDVAVW